MAIKFELTKRSAQTQTHTDAHAAVDSLVPVPCRAWSCRCVLLHFLKVCIFNFLLKPHLVGRNVYKLRT
jgi:hypothetical protein